MSHRKTTLLIYICGPKPLVQRVNVKFIPVALKNKREISEGATLIQRKAERAGAA